MKTNPNRVLMIVTSLLFTGVLSNIAYAKEAHEYKDHDRKSHEHEEEDNHESVSDKTLNPMVAPATNSVVASVASPMTTTAPRGSIKKTMEAMKMAYRAADQSTTMREFAASVATLKAKTEEVSRFVYKGTAAEQQTYKQGLQQLNFDFAGVDNAIKSNNLALAKKALKKLRDTEKTYHRKLDV